MSALCSQHEQDGSTKVYTVSLKLDCFLSIQSLEDRLSMKKDTLLEKSTVLDEVTQLTDNLRGVTSDGRATGAQLAAAANSYQQKLRSVTRKMMATISELSLYQVGGHPPRRGGRGWETAFAWLVSNICDKQDDAYYQRAPQFHTSDIFLFFGCCAVVKYCIQPLCQ